MSRSPPRSGAVRSAAALALLCAAGCLYHFSGGGLPRDVKTVAVLPFDNKTGEPALTQEVNASIRDAVESRLGMREASEANADAVVRGEIVRYDPDIPLSYQAGQGTVDGEYTPPADTDGRKLALDKLVTQVVEGAQSQW